MDAYTEAGYALCVGNGVDMVEPRSVNTGGQNA